MNKIAYLTIDDAPSKDFRRKVDYLLFKKIPAIFFCEGELLNKRPKVVIYAIKKGFIIGNHSYNHQLFSDLTLKQCFGQIKKADEIIDKLYEKAGVKRPAKLFRFPFGDKGGLMHEEVFKRYTGKGKIRKEKIQDFLRKLGYTQPKFKGITYSYYNKAGLLKDVDWNWTYDCFDHTIFDPEPTFGIKSLKNIFERMEEDVPEGCRGLNYAGSEEIIVIHDFTKTAFTFKPIIERLLAKGIIFKLPF